MNPRKRTRRSRKEFWPEIEQQLKEWIVTKRSENWRVSTVAIRLRGKELARDLNLIDFKSSSCWFFLFMKRNNLSFRATA